MIYEQKHSLGADYFTFESRENLVYPKHLHSSYEIIAVTSGCMIVTVDDTPYELNGGDMIFIFPHQIHSIDTPEYSSHTLCIFSERIVGRFGAEVKNKLPGNAVIRNMGNSPLFKLFAASKDSDRVTKIKGLMYLLCDCLSDSTEFLGMDKIYSSSHWLISEMLSYVNKNYKGRCTLKDLSLMMNYNYSYLSNFFSVNIGMSFNGYINHVRVAEACYLLKNGTDTILSVSQSCGFSDLRSFNRNFLKITKMTPSEYREIKT